MKQISKKLALVLMLLVFAVVAVFSVTALTVKSGNGTVVASAETGVSENWYQINYSAESLEILLNGDTSVYRGIDKEEIKAFTSELLSAVRELVANNLLGNVPSVAAASEPEINPDEFDWSDKGLLSNFRDYVLDRLSNPEEFQKFVDGEYDVLIDYAIGNYIAREEGSAADAYDKINSAIGDLVDEAYENALEEAKQNEYFNEEEWIAKKDQAQNKLTERVETVQNNDGKTSITLKQLVAAFKGVSVNGKELYSAINGLSIDAVRDFIKTIPTPAQIAEMSDAELAKLLSVDLEIEVSFGKLAFELNLGFFGKTSVIKSAMRKVADHLDVTVNGNDVAVTATLPEAVSKVYAKFLNSAEFTAEQKNMVFTAFSKTVDEAYDYATSYTYDDVMALLKSETFKKWFDRLTKENQKIADLFDKITTNKENYYNALVRYSELFFELVPEKIKDSAIVDLYDGEKFAGNLSYTVDVSLWASKIANVLRNRGLDKVANYLEDAVLLLDKNTYTVDLSVDVTVPNLYKVDYVLGNETVREGFLPSGIDYSVVETLARINNVEGYEVLYWVDAETMEQISAMPASNLTLVPVTNFEVVASEGVVETYAPYTSYDLGVTVKGISSAKYDYAWYKDGIALENNYKELSVSVVADSGEYYVVVTDKATGVSVKSDVITVDIAKRELELDVSKIKLVEDTAEYTGSYIKFELVEDAFINAGFVAEALDFEVAGDVLTQKNAGEYSVTYTFVLSDEDNYTLNDVNGTTVTLNWSITKVVVIVDSSVLDLVQSDYVYTGSAITVELVEDALANAGYLNNALNLVWGGSEFTQTNAGEYSATVTVTLKDTANYSLVENEEEVESSSKTLAWNIAKAKVVIENVSIVKDSFDYNGREHSISLVDGCYDGELLNVSVDGTVNATNAGNYIVTYTFELVDADNYELNGEAVWAFDWTIAQVKVALGNVVLKANSFVYTGSTRTVSLVTGCYNIALLDVEVSGDTEAKDAGSYQVVYTFTAKDAVNYVIDAESNVVTLDWEITPKIVAAPSAWEDDFTFVYGETVKISYNGIPKADARAYKAVEIYHKSEGIDLYVGATPYTPIENITWNAGHYNIVARVELVSGNYAVEGSDQTVWELENTVDITPKNLNLAGASWNVPDNAVYSVNKEYTVKLNLDGTTLSAADKRLVKELLTYKVGDIKTETLAFQNAGTYVISAVFSNRNYNVTGIPQCEFTISKRNVNVEIIWNNIVEYIYTNSTIEYKPIVNIKVDGYAKDLAESLVNVAYAGCEATVAGSYTAKVTVTLKDMKNYTLYVNGVNTIVGFGSVSAEWSIKQLPNNSFEHDNGVAVEVVSGNVPAGYKTSATEVTVDLKDVEDALKSEFGNKKFEVAAAYDIHFENGAGVEQKVNGKFKVKLPIPEEYLNAKKLVVIHIADDGTVTVVNGATRNGNFMEFETDGFSVFAIISISDGTPWALIISLIVVIVALIICVIITLILVAKKKKQEKAKEEASEEQNEEVAEETAEEENSEVTADETPIEPEAQAEESVEEPVQEETTEVAEEEPAVEEPAVEEPVEEAPVQEEVVEEQTEVEQEEAEEPVETVAEPVEEPVAEETTEVVEEEPVVEEPVQEEVPQAEEVAEPEEEPVVEEPVEEAPVQEEVVEDTATYEEAEEPSPVVEVNVDAVEPVVALPIVDLTTEESYTLSKGFAARLAQADDALKAKYSEVKNHVLSYKGTRARTSWACESLNKGRLKICKLVIKGKTIVMYIAANAEELPAKYHVKSAKGKKYEATPAVLRLRSGRAVKYAKEIIDIVMNGYGIPKKKVYEPVNYAPDYKTDEELLESGLIKKKLSKKSTPWNK